MELWKGFHELLSAAPVYTLIGRTLVHGQFLTGPIDHTSLLLIYYKNYHSDIDYVFITLRACTRGR